MLIDYLPSKPTAVRILKKYEPTPLAQMGWKKIKADRPDLAKYLLSLVKEGELNTDQVTGAAFLLGLMVKTSKAKVRKARH